MNYYSSIKKTISHKHLSSDTSSMSSDSENSSSTNFIVTKFFYFAKNFINVPNKGFICSFCYFLEY